MDCTACELREECRMPVSPSPGIYNIMICGEAPGPREDEYGRGFYEDAPAGTLLWKIINGRGYKRESFHVSNIIHCYPRISRKPNAKQIKICGRFLKKEIKDIQPRIILAFGNTSLQFFIGQKSGIMNLSGDIVWNEEYGAWIVYCLHPAAVLYNPDNKIYFKKGMKSFFRLLRILAPGIKS
jgi:DNA polymerase